MSVTNQDTLDAPLCCVIFGASGDLAMRMLIPSLESISCYSKLHPDTTIIGVARTTFDDASLKDRLAKGIMQYSRIDPESSESCETIPAFLKRFVYVQGEYDSDETYKKILSIVESKKFKGVLYYMATPPSLVELVASKLKQCGLANFKNAWARLVVEKPFGYDVKTAVELNDNLHKYFDEEFIYRIDHYIAKETVMNIFAFRWGNALWEPIWNRNFVSHVEIVVAESVDVGTRMGYYEKSTVVRDMIQNHLLQVLAITAMEPPSVFNANAIRDEKMKVFQSIRPISPEDVIFGQYQGFKQHQGVSPNASAPTMAIWRVYIDNWRWQGVPFYIITGKSLNKKISTIKLVFKEVPHHIFTTNSGTSPNVLKLRIQPNEQIVLKQHVKTPGMGLNTKEIKLKFTYADEFGKNALQGAYERVILDSIRGDQSFFPRSDEIEISWRIVEPLLKENYNVIEYAKGMDVRYGTIKRGCVCTMNQNMFADPEDFVTNSSVQITKMVSEAIKENGICRIALSGGTTPRPIYSQLAQLFSKANIDSSKVHFFFVDERMVPPNDANSNFAMVEEALFTHYPIPKGNIYRMKGELPLQDAVNDYTKQLKDHFGAAEPSFDIILLGMGPDGHIASLFPGTQAVFDRENLVIGHFVPQIGANRITITPRVINNSKTVIVLINDPKKKERFIQATRGPYCPGVLPAQILRRKSPKVIWNVYV